MNLATIFGLAALAIIAILEIYIGLSDKDDEELILPAERNIYSNHYSDYSILTKKEDNN